MMNFKKVFNPFSVCVFSMCFWDCSAFDHSPFNHSPLGVVPVLNIPNDAEHDHTCASIGCCNNSQTNGDISSPLTRSRSCSLPDVPANTADKNDLTALSAFHHMKDLDKDSAAPHIKMPVSAFAAHQNSSLRHRRAHSSSSNVPVDDNYKHPSLAPSGLTQFHTINLTYDDETPNSGMDSPMLSNLPDQCGIKIAESNNRHRKQSVKYTPSREASPSMVTLSVESYHKLVSKGCETPTPFTLDALDPRHETSLYSSPRSIPMTPTNVLMDNREVISILSCDGGGTRGIIPLYILDKIQHDANLRLTFDMYAGTSVGSMVAASVAMEKLEDLYENFFGYAKQIFVPNWFSFGGIWRPTYASSGREKCIQQFVGTMFGRELGSDFIAPYYSALTRTTKVYTNYASNDDLKLSDVLMMSSAAPTYFEPHSCYSEHGTHYVGLDGGIFSNHPGLIAYNEARRKYPDAHIIMLSLGTGKCCTYGNADQFYSRGLLYWGKTFPGLAIESSSWNIHEQLLNLSQSDLHFNYIRLQPTIAPDDLVTDNTDPGYLRNLISACDTYMIHNSHEYQHAVDICSRYCTKKSEVIDM